MYRLLQVLLLVSPLGHISFALPQAPDPTAAIPPNETAALYPPYTYVPSVDADYKPHPVGLPVSNRNDTIHPETPVKGLSNSTVQPNILAAQAACNPIAPTNPGTFWYESIAHNGLAPFIQDSGSYTVFRNVKDFGAKGDGSTDDSTAIQNAINAGNSATGKTRNTNSFGTTGGPAVIYFPQGKYLIRKPIQLYLNTFLIGDPNNRPQLLAASGYSAGTLIFAKDPSTQSATVDFYIGIKNLILVSTAVGASTSITLLDWSVSQACQIANVKFDMPSNSQHTGLAMPEGGSGTMMGNLQFVGGKYGINMNNQQYLIKDSTFTNCNTGIFISHVFDLVVQNVQFSTCGTGIDATNGGVGTVGSVALIDSSATSVGVVVRTKQESTGDDSIVIDNYSDGGAVSSVVTAGGTNILTGSVPKTWVYGNAYLPGGPVTGGHQTGTTYQTFRSAAVLSGGKYVTIAPPTYNEYSLNQIVNVKSVAGLPVRGDGQTDDTANINAILAQNAGCAVTYFPAGTYIVTNTIHIPPGSRIIGEAFSAISASGNTFKDQNAPVPMVQLGSPGDQGVGQISDMLFTVADILPGCILLEVNMNGNSPGDVGIWNSHFRVGGALGSAVETGCTNSRAPCQAAFMLLHLTSSSSVYVENMWGWTADHDLDGGSGQVISTGRGALIEATAGTWLVGTAFEHNTLYQYNLVNAQNVFIGMQQCETVYWQGNGSPALAPAPWVANTVTYHDPNFGGCGSGDSECRMGWFQRISGGSDIFIYGSGFWTFFNDNGDCTGPNGFCQTNAAEVVSNTQNLFWYTYNTKSNVNLLVNNGEVLVTQQNNPGSWGGIVAALLTDSGI